MVARKATFSKSINYSDLDNIIIHTKDYGKHHVFGLLPSSGTSSPYGSKQLPLPPLYKPSERGASNTPP